MRAAHLNRRSVLVLAAGALVLSACNNDGGGAGADGPMFLGKADAPVTVVEYASVACGTCAAWDAQVWPEFKRKYVDTGLVRFELREMLTGSPAIAAAGFLVARCAGREKYFDVVHALYRGQEEMARTGDARGVLQRTALSAGLNQEQFETCVADEDALVAINERNEQNAKVASQGTPTFVIGDKQMVGNQPIEAFDAIIQPLLRQRRTG
jgi:protein-disulfide isomerase